jgi:hypothetical protein
MATIPNVEATAVPFQQWLSCPGSNASHGDSLQISGSSQAANKYVKTLGSIKKAEVALSALAQLR